MGDPKTRKAIIVAIVTLSAVVFFLWPLLGFIGAMLLCALVLSLPLLIAAIVVYVLWTSKR